MAYITLPSPERTKSGFEAFAEGASPYLQMAMETMLKKQMEENQRRKGMEQAQQMFPDAFSQEYEYRGKPFTPGQEYQNKPASAFPKEMRKFLKSTTKFSPEKAPVGFQMKLSEQGIPQFGYEKPQPIQQQPVYLIDPTTGQMKTVNPETGKLEVTSTTPPKGAKIISEKPSLSPILQKQKTKDTSELTSVLSRNELTKQYVTEALNATDNIPSGAIGLLQRKGMEWFDPNNPILAEWQKVKTVLSDVQLGKLQFTKGAISDREMEFFATAVANNNISSVPKIKMILNRALSELEADEEAKKSAYIKNWGKEIESEEQLPQPQEQEDFSQMSDEELRSIAAGG
jgi:hypothetical protein